MEGFLYTTAYIGPYSLGHNVSVARWQPWSRYIRCNTGSEALSAVHCILSSALHAPIHSLRHIKSQVKHVAIHSHNSYAMPSNGSFLSTRATVVTRGPLDYAIKCSQKWDVLIVVVVVLSFFCLLTVHSGCHASNHGHTWPPGVFRRPVVFGRRRFVFFVAVLQPAPGATIMEGFLYITSYIGPYTLGHDVLFSRRPRRRFSSTHSRCYYHLHLVRQSWRAFVGTAAMHQIADEACGATQPLLLCNDM